MTVTEWVNKKYWRNINTALIQNIADVTTGKRIFEFKNWSEKKPKTIGLICDILVKCSLCDNNLKEILYKYPDGILKNKVLDSIKQGLSLNTVINTGLLVGTVKGCNLESKDFSIILEMLEESLDVLNNIIGSVCSSECETKYYSGITEEQYIYMGTPDLIVNNTLFEFKVSKSNKLQTDWIIQVILYYCLVLIKKYHLCILESGLRSKSYYTWCSTHNITRLVVFNILTGNYYSIKVSSIPRVFLREIMLYAFNNDLPTLQRLSLEHMESVLFSSINEIDVLRGEISYLKSEIRYMKT